MSAIRWVFAVLLFALLATPRPAAAEPATKPATKPATEPAAKPVAEDDEHEAVRAYQAKDYTRFLAHMRALHAREPAAPRVIYNLAAAEALAGSPDAAIERLRQLAGTGLSFAIDKDDDFRALRKRADFAAVARTMKANLAPRGRAEPAFALRERDLLTEGVAFDPDTRTWFVSSVRHRKIIAIDARGRQRDFITEGQDGIAGVFGMSIDRARHVLWAASTAVPHMIGYRPDDKDRSALYKLDLATGKLAGVYRVPRDGRPHALGDVIVSSHGDAFATDSASPILYRVDAARDQLEVVLDGGFASLQGLALSADEATLYLADYARGVYALALADKRLVRLDAPPDVAATGIDGLYLHRGWLIATQNGAEPRRVVALALDPAGGKIASQQILLSGDPRTRDLSLAAIADGALYLNAASGWAHYADDGTPDARQPAAPHAILKLALPR
jgi:sugar lactone lactonase YvrE